MIVSKCPELLGRERSGRAKTYRDFGSEYARLQNERIAAYTEYRDDVATGAYPEPGHTLRIADDELAAFLASMDAQD